MIPLVSPTHTPIDPPNWDGAVDEFEQAFANRVGCTEAVAVCSGTMALTIAIHTLGRMLQIPSYCCAAIQNAATIADVTTDLVDVDYSVERALACQHGGQLLVHHFGRPTIHIDNQPALIEDWTLSLGHPDLKLTSDTIGVCSTHETKMISTGRGGIIFANNPDLIATARDLALQDQGRSFNYSIGMSNPQAMLGLTQLAQLDAFIARRQDLAHRYSEAFKPAGIECPDQDTGSVFFRYLIRVEGRDRRIKRLARRGIEAGRGVSPPLHRLERMRDEDFPGTTRASDTLLSIPCHPAVTDSEADLIIDAVKEVCAP